MKHKKEPLKFISLQITSGLFTGLGFALLIIGLYYVLNIDLKAHFHIENLLTTQFGREFGISLIFIGLIIFIFGETISLFLAIEINTRNKDKYLDEQNRILIDQVNLLINIAQKIEVPVHQIDMMLKDMESEK